MIMVVKLRNKNGRSDRWNLKNVITLHHKNYANNKYERYVCVTYTAIKIL